MITNLSCVPVLVVLFAIGCSGQPAALVEPAAPDDSTARAAQPSPTAIPERETEFATAEAARKSSAGECQIEPNAQCEGADLASTDLAALQINKGLGEGVDLSGANLRFANLSGVNLYLADLSSADLTGANLRGAYLNNVNFKNAILRDADLTDANLSWALIRDADMEGAILCNTLMPDGGTSNDGC